MGTWKKMAEAFGRAMHSPKVSETKFNRFAHSAMGSPETEKAFVKGLDEGEDAGRRIEIDDRDSDFDDKLESDFDAEVDALTDRKLEQNASDEWDEAFARRKQGVRDWYGKDYPKDMAEEGAEAFEKQLWELVDDLKAKGVSAQDILNRIKGND